jgi:hypothetical protein
MMKQAVLFSMAWLLPLLSSGDIRHERFDQDPLWDGLNNFSQIGMRPVVQDFGYSATTNCNAIPGEVGGTITPDAQMAYYAKRLAALTLNDSFSASGKMLVSPGGGNTLLGFFNPARANEWRMANSIVFRIYGRGDVFQVHFEYGTSLWRASAGMFPGDFPSGTVCTWSLTYTPVGTDSGEVVAVFNGQSSTCTLSPGHRGDGAVFTHCGLLNVLKHPDDTGRLWIDEVVINGVPEDFSADPGWDEFQTQASYLSEDTRPRFAFGYSPTQYGGGMTPGEIGGRFFRGDCRYPETLAYYGAPIADLSLESRLEATGKVCLRRAVSDSTTLFGFFHSERSVAVNPSQSQSLPAEFLGLAIEGPSADGFYIYPCYRTQGDGAGRQYVTNLPPIYPDSQTRDWTLTYDPDGNGGGGEIRLTCGGRTAVLPLLPGHKALGAQFNRFGFVTPWVDGNGQLVYFDDLSYTYDIPTRAMFSAVPREGHAPLDVSFLDESVSKHAITDWTWDFGDGSAVSHEQNPVHTYTQDGAYTVRLTIDTAADSDTITAHWFIEVGNSLPGPALPALGLAVAAMLGFGLRRLRK